MPRPEQMKLGVEVYHWDLSVPPPMYASPVWDPHYQTDFNFLEKIQKRGARFATGNYCMESGNSQLNYHHLGWPSFVERRLQAKLTILQKARLKLLDLPLDKIQTKSRTMRLGGVNSFARNCSPVNCHFYLFFPQTTQLWNDLPLDTGSSEDIDI